MLDNGKYTVDFVLLDILNTETLTEKIHWEIGSTVLYSRSWVCLL